MVEVFGGFLISLSFSILNILTHFSPAVNPLFLGGDVNPHDFFGIETVRTHDFVGLTVATATRQLVGFSIIHTHDKIVGIDGLEGLDETVD